MVSALPDACSVRNRRNSVIEFKAMPGGRAVAILAIICGLGAASPALAQSPADFYRGKTITIVLGHPPGGSYDL